MSRFIITGAPGCGKTAIFSSLRQKGFICMSNDIDLLVQEQSRTVRGIFPWSNIRYFAQNCLGRMWKTYERSKKHNQVILFDQGIPDLMAYLRNDSAPVLPIYLDTLENCHYYPVVFLCQISQQDYPQEELSHPYSLDEALQLENLIQDTYRQLDFEVVYLNQTSAQTNTQMIVDKIQTIENDTLSA